MKTQCKSVTIFAVLLRPRFAYLIFSITSTGFFFRLTSFKITILLFSLFLSLLLLLLWNEFLRFSIFNTSIKKYRTIKWKCRDAHRQKKRRNKEKKGNRPNSAAFYSLRHGWIHSRKFRLTHKIYPQFPQWHSDCVWMVRSAFFSLVIRKSLF